MSGLSEVSLNEKIAFLESVVIPSFDVDHEFKNSKERKEWMRVTAKKDGWPNGKASLLNRIFSTISSLKDAEEKLKETKQERQQQQQLQHQQELSTGK